MKVIALSDLADEEFTQLQYEIAVNALSKFNVHPNPKECLEICILRRHLWRGLQLASI